ncbi:hypothetical protein CYY_000835 [Polysphondylium violaceum]|uniref:ATP synthase subunit d, mitochondrial n=1 Tax=Polysphondylium violaceum TaxID=133409 RepID=A0A8J4Q0U0_9MYCE|nr:hypothetical protein CYY_000835 [Polysphondylium violaceum]
MFRHGLRLFSQATETVVAASTKPSATQVYLASGTPAHLIPYITGEKTMSDVELVSDDYIKNGQHDEKRFNEALRSPLVQESPEFKSLYDRYTKQQELEDQLSNAKETKINWEFYKKVLPVSVVESFQKLESDCKKQAEKWVEEDKKFFEGITLKMKESCITEDVIDFYKNEVKNIDKEIEKHNYLLQNIDTITFAELEGKFPEIEQEIYEEIADNQWMIGDTVLPHEDIYATAQKAHHH